MNNNYAALAAAAVASSSSSSSNTTSSNTNTNAQRNQIDQISPPLTNTTSSAIPSNNSNNNNGLSNLPPNLLNQLNLANSVSSSNRQSAQVNPFFRSNSTMPTNPSQQQQQQLSNLIQQQQQLQQQKKLAGSSNLLNFPNSNMNNSLLSGTIGRPSQLQTNPQTNPSDFPVLHRTSNSPFQQQHLAQLQQQLRANSTMNQFPQGGPNSAPILNSSSLQNFMLQLASSASAQNSNLAQSPASQMMMNNLAGQGNNALPYGLGLNSSLSQQMNALNVAVQKNVQVGGNMWSNFGLKSQQSGNDQQHQEFNIQQEDFPALPRPQSVNNKTSEGAGQNLTRTNSSSSNDLTTLQRMNEPTNNLQHSSSQNNVNSSSSSMLNTNSSGSSSSNSALNNTTTSSNNTKGGNGSTQNPTSNTNNNNNNASSNNTTNKSNSVNTNQLNTGSSGANNSAANAGSNSSSAAKKGIIISPDGRISNVPPNMLLDQFGMVGLLAYLRAADREKDFFALALGTDLTALGLNLNSNENLYHSFLSPFSDVPCRLQDIDYPVPTEYIMNGQIKEKLAPIDVSRYNEDTLFYLFHMNGGDLMQLQAASVLYDRDWRYHTEKRFWLTKVPGLEPQQKTVTFEKGVYTVFDVNQWRRLQLEMTIEYSKLAEKPHLPPGVLSSSGSSQQQQGNNQNNNNNSIPSVLNLQQQLQHQQQMQQTFNAGLGSNNVGVPLTTNPTSASSF